MLDALDLYRCNYLGFFNQQLQLPIKLSQVSFNSSLKILYMSLEVNGTSY